MQRCVLIELYVSVSTYVINQSFVADSNGQPYLFGMNEEGWEGKGRRERKEKKNR